MLMQLKKWGNSQGLRLSKDLLSAAGIGVEDSVNVNVEHSRIVISRADRHRTLEERMKDAGLSKMPNYKEFNWESSPVGREVW